MVTTQRNLRTPLCYLEIGDFCTSVIRCCVRAGVLSGSPNSSVCRHGARSREVLASANILVRFSPVTDATCRPPISKNLDVPFKERQNYTKSSPRLASAKREKTKICSLPQRYVLSPAAVHLFRTCDVCLFVSSVGANMLSTGFHILRNHSGRHHRRRKLDNFPNLQHSPPKSQTPQGSLPNYYT